MTRLTPAQRGVWSGHVLAADKTLYNTAECLFFSGKVDPARLIAAIGRAVAEAPVLASFYRVGEDGRGERIAIDRERQPLPVSRRRLLPGLDVRSQVKAWARGTDLETAFDLDQGWPCRFVLFEGDAGDALYMAAHHVALDGFGYALFWERLATHYAGDAGRELASFDAAFGVEPTMDAAAAARSFWSERLATYAAVAPTASDAVPSRHYQDVSWTMSNELWERLNAAATTAKTNWADVLTAILAMMARTRADARSSLVGLPILNRTGAALRVPCMQMNLIPLCVPLVSEDSLSAFAIKIGLEKRESRHHQWYRHEDMTRDQRAAGATEKTFGPVINILPFPKAMAFGSLTADKEIICPGPTLDLALNVHYVSQQVAPGCQLLGNAAIWSRDRLDQWRHRYERLIAAWADDPRQTVAGLWEVARAVERSERLIGGNAPATAAQDVLDRLADVVAVDTNRIAIVHDGQNVSYGELWRRVDRWAGALVAQGIGRGDAVGVMMVRSPEAIVALLAILRVGAAYVPLDAKAPMERLASMQRAAHLRQTLTADDVSWLELGTHAPGVTDATLPAYVLFTSGSTGQPKGVVISRGALSHFVASASERYGVVASDRVLQFAPATFDTSLEETFLALANGATLVLRNDAMLNSFGDFASAVAALNVTVLDLPTAYWTTWVDALTAGLSHVPACVQKIVLGGEAVHAETLRRWFQLGVTARLINSYGPTETTIVATTIELRPEHAFWPALPIGRPLSGVGLLVVDRAGFPADEGELVVVGATVGSHYLGDGRALRSQWRIGAGTSDGYATGDRVAQRGRDLVFLGRVDDEFKISGHRVQPLEIESHLLQVPGISDACVVGVVGEDGRRSLVAFVAAAATSVASIRQALHTKLPAVLVPGVIKILTRLPVTSTNKIDRAALAVEATHTVAPAAPDMAAEASIAAIVRSTWREQLGHDDFDDRSNFFAVGGQSLQTIQLALRLSKAFDRFVDVSDVFSFPVLADLCRHIGDKVAAGRDAAPVRLIDLGEHPAAGRIPVYAFPGMGGGSSQFVDLARRAARVRFRVFEINAAALGDARALAVRCADLIASECRQGPVTLLGHSYGGCIAFEVAAILRQRGFDTELNLLDTYLHLVRSAVDGLTYRPSGRYAGRARRYYASEATHYPAHVLAEAKRIDAGYFSGVSDVRYAPGDHFSMLVGAHADELAGQLAWI